MIASILICMLVASSLKGCHWLLDIFECAGNVFLATEMRQSMLSSSFIRSIIELIKDVSLASYIEASVIGARTP